MNQRYEQIGSFCDHWVSKTKAENDGDWHQDYDRFIALYIAFNRLYQESARILLNENNPLFVAENKKRTKKPDQRFEPLPDRKSATEAVIIFCGEDKIEIDAKDLKVLTSAADGNDFYFHENYSNQTPDKDEDRKISDQAKNGSKKSALALIYQARCNLFHGEKELHGSQSQLLKSMGNIVEALINSLKIELKERLN